MYGAGASEENLVIFMYFIDRWDDLATGRTNATGVLEDFGQVNSPSLMFYKVMSRHKSMLTISSVVSALLFAQWNYLTHRFKEKFIHNFRVENITYPPIYYQLLLHSYTERRKVFNGPIVMPNGTWDNRSGVCHAATKNYTFIPARSKIWLCGLRCFDERDTNFIEDVVSESALV